METNHVRGHQNWDAQIKKPQLASNLRNENENRNHSRTNIEKPGNEMSKGYEAM